MKKTIILLIIFTFFLVASTVGIIVSYINQYPSYELIMSLGSMIIGAIIPYYINFIISFTDYSPFNKEINKLLRTKAITDNTEFRISFGYLFRIEINGKYFLIRDNHGFSKYKVPGGTYMVSDKEREYINKKFITRDDDVYDERIDDYRLYVPAHKLASFYRRFKKVVNENMGNNFIRNFVERLDYVPNDLFKKVNTRFVRRDFVIKYPKHFNCFELVLADIIEIKLSPAQKELFTKLEKERVEDDKYYVATKEEIITRGQSSPERQENQLFISDHSYKILPQFINQTSIVDF